MAQSVQEYVKNCLICIRQSIPQPQRLLQSVLTKPLPLQTISMDHVGPLEWGGIKVYFAVIIDHATRFMMAQQCSPTMKESVQFLQNHWCEVFQAPNTVLTDRGSAFRSGFNQFVTQSLLAYHIFTSPYYPQGNSINEAAHKSLNRSLSAYQLLDNSNFSEALSAAVAVHNSCPHSSLGVSPFFAMFGFEPTLPGWQKYRNQHDDALRSLRLTELRQKQLLKAQLDRENYKVVQSDNIQVGDWVVYLQSKYEKKVTSPEGTNIKYSPLWSLPAKVTQVKPTIIYARNWGTSDEPRQIPKTQVYKLEGNLPPSLQQLTLRLLEYDSPRAVVPRMVPKHGSLPVQTWSDLLENVEVSNPKRLRRNSPSTPEENQATNTTSSYSLDHTKLEAQ